MSATEFWCQNCSRVPVREQGHVCKQCFELLKIGQMRPLSPDHLSKMVSEEPPKSARDGRKPFFPVLLWGPLDVVVMAGGWLVAAVEAGKLLKLF